MLVQIYEIQEPREAERLIEMGVDRIGSVILSPEQWKVPVLRDVVRMVRGSGTKSSLIPLMTQEDGILRALDYYEPDYVHFCEWIPIEPEMGPKREALCAEMVRLQCSRNVQNGLPNPIFPGPAGPGNGDGAHNPERGKFPFDDVLETDHLRAESLPLRAHLRFDRNPFA